jgi:tetratricopeptide (TPR) repeat protein
VATVAEVFALALNQFNSGKFPQAEQLCRQILHADASLANAWCFLGAVCQTQGKVGEAISAYQTALRLKPAYAEAHYNLGVALASQGQGDAAIMQQQQALSFNPDYADAIQELLRVLALQEERALKGKHRAERTCSNNLLYAQAHYNLGVVLGRQGKQEESVGHYRWALRLNPENVEAHNNLANALHQTGKLDEAVACYHAALRCRPDCAEVYTNLGTALVRLGRLDEAVGVFRQAITIKPTFPEAYSNLGEALKELGQLDQSEASFEQALRQRSDFAEARWNRSLLWLLRGEFDRGWPEYEWRWSQPGIAGRSFPQPRWDGSALDGRTILLHAEQGLGDTLHFIRYVPLVIARGGKVVLECQPELFPLLSGSQLGAHLVSRGTNPPPFNVQAPLLSLPGIFRTDFATIPASIPYLDAKPVLVEHWRQELAQSDVRSTNSQIGPTFKVGIAWQGSPTYRYDRQRSIPLAHFARLADIKGVQLISLQKGSGIEQLDKLPDRAGILDLGSCLDTPSGPFMDTAAVMKNLDLVICSDSAIAHLAGALGVPVWLALPLVPDWRWLLEREDSPWYPTMRLFRQKTFGLWDEVFERLAEALNERRQQAQHDDINRTKSRGHR